MRNGIGIAIFLAAVVCLSSGKAAEPPRVAPADLLPRSEWPLGDPPEKWEPRSPTSEEESDRAAAEALFVRGRIAEQRDAYPEALKFYQRAHRLDPSSITILRAIVPLAFELNRNHEAARYAVLAAEAQPTDLVLLRQLAMHLLDEGETRRARRLLELALQLPAASAQPPSPASLLMRFELGRLQLEGDESLAAVKTFEPLRTALLSRDPRGLAPELRKLLEQRGELTWGLLGEAFFRAERFDEAEALFRRAEGVRPQPAIAALRQAKLSLARKDSVAALGHLATYFGTGSEEGSEEAIQLLERAVAARQSEGAEANAKREFERRLRAFHEKTPGHRPLAQRLAALAAARGDWEEADRLTTRIVERAGDAESERSWIEARRHRRNPERLLEALAAVADKRMSLDVLGAEIKAIAKDADLVQMLLAVAERQQKLAADSRAGGLLLAGALLAIEVKKPFLADSLFAAAAEAKKPGKGNVLLAAGLAWTEIGDEARAAAIWQRAIREQVLQEKTPDLYYYLAGSLATIGKTDEALRAAEEAVALEPDSVTKQLRPLWVLYFAGRYAAAEKGYRTLLQKYDARRDSQSLRLAMREARLVLSHLAQLQGRPADADEWIEQALDEFPEDPGALNDLGYLWADRGIHLARAQRMIEQAVAARPENASYRDSLGWVYFRRGKSAEAIAELEKAAKSDSPGGVVWDHLGDAYRQAKRHADAISAWKNAAEAYAKDGKQREAEAARGKIAAPGPSQ